MGSSAQRGPQPIEAHRAYLHLLARMHIRGAAQAQIDPSDVVQETLFKAHRKIDQFQGQTDKELAAWLRQILARTLADAARKLQKAEIAGQGVEESAFHFEAWLAAEEQTPSAKVVRQEELLELARALEQLPDDQRTALELKHLHGWSVAQISQHMGRTKMAVGGLLRRAVKGLRQTLRGGER